MWPALSAIPYATTAHLQGRVTPRREPQFTRAVGLANNRNPIALFVPCHRVIGADGSLTGYGGGLEMKSWLLDHEQPSQRGPGRPGCRTEGQRGGGDGPRGADSSLLGTEPARARGRSKATAAATPARG